MLTACILDQQQSAFQNLSLLSEALQLQLPVCIAPGTHWYSYMPNITWVLTRYQEALTWQHVQHQYLTLFFRLIS